MSYILDALRKSDAQRRLGQPPDLNTPAGNGGGKRKRERRAVLPIAVLLTVVIAAVLVGRLLLPLDQWFGEKDQVAELIDSSSTPETLPVAMVEEPASDDGPEAAEPDVAEQGSREEVEIADRRSPTLRPATTVTRPAPARQPVAPAREREGPAVDAAEAQRLIEAAEHRAPQPTPATPETPEIETLPVDPATEGGADEEWTPERSEFLRSWELPLAVRRELPELRLSIHVFSPQAQDRFVLINGERRLEGDDLGGGASLVEIRREGVLVRFRDYSFLLEP